MLMTTTAKVSKRISVLIIQKALVHCAKTLDINSLYETDFKLEIIYSQKQTSDTFFHNMVLSHIQKRKPYYYFMQEVLYVSGS